MNHHRSVHNAAKLACEKCNSVFSFKGNLLRHRKACKGNSECQKMLKCVACGKRFKRIRYLLDHIKGQHKPPSHECANCKQKFPY